MALRSAQKLRLFVLLMRINMNVMMRSGNILNQRHARRLMSTNAPQPSWRNFSEVIVPIDQQLSCLHLEDCILYFCGQIIWHSTVYRRNRFLVPPRTCSGLRRKFLPDTCSARIPVGTRHPIQALEQGSDMAA